MLYCLYLFPHGRCLTSLYHNLRAVCISTLSERKINFPQTFGKSAGKGAAEDAAGPNSESKNFPLWDTLPKGPARSEAGRPQSRQCLPGECPAAFPPPPFPPAAASAPSRPHSFLPSRRCPAQSPAAAQSSETRPPGPFRRPSPRYFVPFQRPPYVPPRCFVKGVHSNPYRMVPIQ